ncbi:hypothetical protein BH23GEM1_BH23GEM1_09310 [soil metagenome]
MTKLALIFCALGFMACAAVGPVTQPAVTDAASAASAASAADRGAVIAVVQSLFEAMRTRDTSAIRAAFAPHAQLVSIRTVPGAAPRVQVQPLAAFVSSIGGAPGELVERMWDPRVEVAGDIASLWAPYDFRIGGTFSHCGHDAVHLVRTEYRWKITGITYTVITDACATR